MVGPHGEKDQQAVAPCRAGRCTSSPRGEHRATTSAWPTSAARLVVQLYGRPTDV